MPASARLIVMMQPDEKAALEARAAAAKVSTAEFVRRRLVGRETPEEEAFLEMLAELKPVVQTACRTIDADLAAIRAIRESADRRDARAARLAHGEFTREELLAIADRMPSTARRRSAPRRRGGRA